MEYGKSIEREVIVIMRSLKKNTQKLYYATYNSEITIYERDSAGNIIYDEIGGEEIPRILSEKAGYNNPVSFYANISMSGGEANPAEYGFDLGSYEAVLVTTDKTLPIDELSLIWHITEPSVGADGIVDESTADYRVIAVKPSLNSMKYLLKMITKTAKSKE